MWWSRNNDGFWCNFCGNLLKPDFHFDDDDEWDEFEAELDDGRCCDKCDPPEEFSPAEN